MRAAIPSSGLMRFTTEEISDTRHWFQRAIDRLSEPKQDSHDKQKKSLAARNFEEDTLKTRVFAVSAAIFVLAALAPSVASAATPRCFGKKATIVSNKSLIKGTKKADVIFSRSNSSLNLIYGKGGNDLICGGPQFDLIFGGPGHDKMRGNGGIDFLSGDGGNDRLVGDVNDGGNADDAYYQFSPVPVNVNLDTGTATGQGTDTLQDIDGVFGSDHNDTITGDENTNFIWGNGGDDVINGGGDLDLIDPGDGDDTSNGGSELDPTTDMDIYYVSGATGTATVDLQAGTASGSGIGSDTLSDFENVVGSNFADVISGDGGSNILFGGAGNDLLDGRGGFDYASYWFAAGPVNANLSSGSSTSAVVPNPDAGGVPADVGEGSDTLQALEGLLGSISFGDTLTGDNFANYLDGDGGTDTISGGGGDDWIIGGNGVNEVVNGGPGLNDFWDYYGTGALNVNLANGTITGDAALGTVQITGVESVAGADQADTFVGDGEDNTFFGWAGNDTFTGGLGDDSFHGGLGDDTVTSANLGDICWLVEVLGGCEEATEEIELPNPTLSEAASAIETLRRNF
jgi:Ca2+-binding RTX toxin-like protein